MPSPIHYRCETLVTPLYPDRITASVVAQTVPMAARAFGYDHVAGDGQVFSIASTRGGATSYWEWRRGHPYRLAPSEIRRRFPPA